MKKALGFVMVLIMTVCLAAPNGAEAASAKTIIKKLVKNMRSYEYSLITEMNLMTGEGYDILFDNEHMAQAAALTTDLLKAKAVESNDEGFDAVYAVSSSKVKKMSKKLFGTAVSYKKLPKGKGDGSRGLLYAYRDSKGKPRIYCWEGETDCDFETRSVTITKSGKGYKVTKAIFYGHWGENKDNKVNYGITYSVVPSDASSYGYVITEMSIKRFAD